MHIFCGHKPHGFIFAERDGSSDHNAFEQGDVTAEDAPVVAARLPYDGRDVSGLRTYHVAEERCFATAVGSPGG